MLLTEAVHHADAITLYSVINRYFFCGNVGNLISISEAFDRYSEAQYYAVSGKYRLRC